MSQIRFHHVFAGLLALSVLSAFVLPARVTNPARSNIQNIFAPVAMPIRSLASWIRGRVTADKPVDDARLDGSSRSLKDVLEENRQLRERVANLTGQFKSLQRVDAERAMIKEDVRKLCTPVSVVGGDSGMGRSLSLLATALDGIQKDMPVLYAGGLAGRIERVGLGGTQMQLVTDKDFRVTCSFNRFVKKSDGGIDFVPLAFPPQVVSGDGNHRMVISRLVAREVEASGLAKNDWVVLEDSDWPLCVQGQLIGKIVESRTSHDGPLFVELIVEPTGNLMALREVMVLTKTK